MNNPTITKLSLLTILILILVAVNVWLIQRLPVSAAGEPLTISAPVTFSGGYTISSPQFIDTANSAYFLDPAATGDSLVLAGTATASGNLTVGNTNAIRAAFGPLSLQYKSGLDAWTTGLTLQDTTGNVGIGTTTPASKLTVAGTVESTTGGFKFPDATTQTSAATGMTSGMIAAFETSCPSGWTEYTAGRGRVIVGMPLSGTSGGTVGTALTNLEDRTHTHTGPSHTHTGPSHTHSGPNHTHTISSNYVSEGHSQSPPLTLASGQTTSSNGTGATSADGTGATSASGTGATGTAATSNVMPYLQLLWCKKD